MSWACAWVVILGLALVVNGEGPAASAAAPAAAPAPGKGVDCSNVILGMADCLNYVSEGSTVAKPEGDCCSGLKEVVKEDVSCLCDAFQEASTFGIKVNMTKALSLPSACGVSTPSITKCKNSISGVPVAAPAPSPSSSPSSPSSNGAPSSSPSSNGDAPVPSPEPGKNKSAAVIWAPTSAHLISLAFVLFFYFWL